MCHSAVVDRVPVRRRYTHPAKVGRKPVHQITFRTSRARPSSRSGRPCRVPTVRGTLLVPAAAKSVGPIPINGTPRRSAWAWSRRLSQESPVAVRYWLRLEPRVNWLPKDALWQPANIPTGQPGGATARELDRDLCT